MGFFAKIREEVREAEVLYYRELLGAGERIVRDALEYCDNSVALACSLNETLAGVSPDDIALYLGEVERIRKEIIKDQSKGFGPLDAITAMLG